MDTGLITIIVFFVVFHMVMAIAFVFNREKLKKIGNLILNMIFDLVYELGKTLLMAGVVGVFFIPDQKDFTKALISGIIFFIIGYIMKNRKDLK